MSQGWRSNPKGISKDKWERKCPEPTQPCKIYKVDISDDSNGIVFTDPQAAETFRDIVNNAIDRGLADVGWTGGDEYAFSGCIFKVKLSESWDLQGTDEEKRSPFSEDLWWELPGPEDHPRDA